MKIVVLCGGLSTERKISFSSGTKICAALRKKGHQAVLDAVLAHPETLFDTLPELAPVIFDGKAPDLDAVRASRKWKSPSLFGRGVLELCSKADMVFIALHGLNGEDGRVQAAFDLMGIPYTGSGYLGAAMTDPFHCRGVEGPLCGQDADRGFVGRRRDREGTGAARAGDPQRPRL